MDKINKYLNESKEKDAIRGMDNDDAINLKDSYYSVADEIENLANNLNVLVGETGLFVKDLKLAVQARDAFRKMTLGKYI
jgi:hypothetical protein